MRRNFQTVSNAPVRGGECGLGRGVLAVGGDARRRISSSTPQGSFTSSTCHRVSPVNEKYQNLQQNRIRQAVLPV